MSYRGASVVVSTGHSASARSTLSLHTLFRSREDLADHVVQHHRERDEVDVDGEQHQLDRHHDDDDVLAVQKNRSEEHTSELQSHVNLVCRLLLEKKKSYEGQIDLPDVDVEVW